MTIFILIVGIALLVGGIIYAIICSYQKSENKKTITKKPLPLLFVLSVILIVVSQCFVIVPTGYTGVKSVFGQINDTPALTGFNGKIPFAESITLVNNKQQDKTLATDTSLSAESVEKIPVTVSNVTVTYQIDQARATWIYANVSDINSLVTDSLVSSALKASTVTLNVADVTNRAKVEPMVAEYLQSDMDAKYGAGTITIIRVVIGNMDYEDSYNSALNDKNKAQQAAEQQAIENQKNIDKAAADAEVKKTVAEGDAEAIRIEAEAQAAANQTLTASLNEMILANNWIVKWDGKMPVVTDSSGNIIDISSLLNQNQSGS